MGADALSKWHSWLDTTELVCTQNFLTFFFLPIYGYGVMPMYLCE